MGNNGRTKKHTSSDTVHFFFFSSYVCNTVSPMIFVPNQLVGAPSGTDVAIDCNTEAHPKYIKNPFLYKILFLFLHALFMIWYAVYFVGIRSTYHATIYMRQFRPISGYERYNSIMLFLCVSFFFWSSKTGKKCQPDGLYVGSCLIQCRRASELCSICLQWIKRWKEEILKWFLFCDLD